MKTQIAATYFGGVFRPDEMLPLQDQTRVNLTFELADVPPTPEAAWSAIKARLAQRPIRSAGVRYSRDELHERR
jgi:hypothetical protein